jgi:hypothetical protein
MSEAKDTSETVTETGFIFDTYQSVIASLRDVDEVKLLAFMILERLSVVAEAAVVSRLDELAESIEAIVNGRLTRR